ncbi:MAG: hypothetical protein ACR65X_09570 [Methylocystis sp.]
MARRLGELRKVIANGRAHKLPYWRTLGFLAGNALCLFRPGRYFEPGRKVPSRWPEATVENALGRKDSPAHAAIEALVDRHGTYLRERIYTAIADGMREGERWTRKHRRLVSAHEAAKRLRVDYEEREELGLRSIGAGDMTREDIKLEGRRKKRERDRERMECKRRAAGVVRREQYLQNSLSKTRPWEAEGISRRTWERRRKQADDRVVASVSPHNRRYFVSSDNSQGDGLASRPTPTSEFPSSEETRGVPSSLKKSSESETTFQLAALTKNTLRRSPAPQALIVGDEPVASPAAPAPGMLHLNIHEQQYLERMMEAFR